MALPRPRSRALPRPAPKAVRRVSLGLVLGAAGGWVAGLLRAPRKGAS